MLAMLRNEWILGRGDVEKVASSYKPIAGRSDVEIPSTLRRQPLRAKPGKIVTQLHYARQWTVTPEMEFIALREGLGTVNLSAVKWRGAGRLFPPTSIIPRASR